jgi:plasmid stabilization system protein ParE
MSRRLIIKLKAELDICDARDWHERRRNGLGDDFVQEVDAALTNIVSAPSRFMEISPGYRRALVARFPYLIVFRFDDAEIVVIGVYRASRNPRRWKERIKQDRAEQEHE